MINKLIKFIGAATFLAAALVSCQKQESGKEPEQEETQHLVVTVDNIGETTAELSVKNDDPTRTIYFGIHPKSEYDTFSSEASFIRSTIYFLDQKAAYYQMTLEDLLSGNLMAGDIEAYGYEDLDPETEYVAYAFGLSEAGEATTDLAICVFTTLPVGTQECTFKIEASNITGTSFDFTIQPSNPNTRYFYGVISPDNWESYCEADAEAGIKELVNLELSEYIASDDSYTLEAAIDTFTVTGGIQVEMDALSVNNLYHVFAIGMGVDGTFTTAPSYIEVQTDSRSDNSFRLELVSKSSTSATFNIVADLALETFAFALVRSDEISGKTEKQIMDMLCTDSRLATYSGIYQYEATGLLPETSYTLCVFGYSLGASTTDLFSLEMQTDPYKIYTENMFTISVYDITQTSASFSFTPNGEAEGLYYYFDIMTEEDYREGGANEDALKADMEKGLDYYAKYWGVDRTAALDSMMHTGYVSAQITTLKKETQYRVYVVGMYADGTICTPFQSKRFETLSDHELIEMKVTYQDLTSTGGSAAWYVYFYPPENTEIFYSIATVSKEYETLSDEELLKALLKTFKYTYGYHYYSSASIDKKDLADDGIFYCYCVAYANGEPGVIQRAAYNTKTNTWE